MRNTDPICRIPESSYSHPGHPELNRIRFEVQMRSILQHAWANMNHDTGYKSGVEIPRVYMRNMSRLAGMLELVDDEFSRIRRDDTDLRYAGSNGLYWSSSLTTDSPFYALLVNFYSVSVDRNSGLRCLGFSVRPVSE